MYKRFSSSLIDNLVKRKKNILLLGPRQVGKTTLIENLLKSHKQKKIIYKFQDIQTFEEVVKSPWIISSRIKQELENSNVILFIDEAQKIPKVLDGCQDLIDTYKDRLTVILSGSSARKLRSRDVNLLPGRIFVEYLFPLIIPEIYETNKQFILPLKPKNKNSNISLEEILTFGTLPGVLNEDLDLKEKLLKSYSSTYLQEEIRQEAITRNIGNFAKFLELAAFESGNVLNLTNISQDSGIPINTVKNYFQVLEDTLIAFSLPAFTPRNSRRQALSTPKYLFFDIGIKNIMMGNSLNPKNIKGDLAGKLFEHFIVTELIKRIRYSYPNYKYFFWRTNHGLEVDFIIQTEDEIIPIEIKYTNIPQKIHIKNLELFMNEYECKRGFLIGTFKEPLKLTSKISAIPWKQI